jgi:hypothetical protein
MILHGVIITEGPSSTLEVNSVNCQIPGRAQSLGPFVLFAVRDTGKQMPVQIVKTGLLSHSLKLSTSCRSVVKQKGMVFGFRKTATAVTRPER